ncbi:MAG: delta-class carbonic anhydrase [Hyphomicrobiaceae bacterium]
MRHKTVLSSVAAAVLGIGLGSVASAQETDTTLNAFSTVKLEIKDGTKTTRGCKAVYSGTYSPSNPSSNPFQLVVEIDPEWHAVDIPTTSTVKNAKVTFKTGSGEQEQTFSVTQQRDDNLIASKFVRIVNQSNLLNRLVDVTGNLRVTVEGDPIEYTYNVGQMRLMFTALESCFDSLGPGASCEVAGPQTPRDIADKRGEHRITFGFAPEVANLNLCNIHFHATAEHKGPGFSLKAPGEGGYLCTPVTLTDAEKAEPADEGCEAEPGQSRLKPGDTIEVHWVYTSCDVKPGKGLDSCASKSCANPALRVESQVFMLVNDPNAAKISDYDYAGQANTAGLHQAKALPAATGAVLFRGSTTGRKYNDKGCSPYQATWNVRPACAKLDINSLNTWCKGNVFKEAGGHDVRELVTELKQLDPIQ